MFNLTKRVVGIFTTTKKPPNAKSGPSLKSPEVRADPVFPTRFHALIYRRPAGLELARQIELYINSEAYRQKFKSKLVLFRYNSYCLHHWLLSYRLGQELSWRSWRVRKSLSRLLEDYTRDHVYEYQASYFNVKIYHELIRVQKAIFWSLDDYFFYGFKGKQLRQVVEEDVLLEDTGVQMEEYIHGRIAHLMKLKIEEILRRPINWGYQSDLEK